MTIAGGPVYSRSISRLWIAVALFVTLILLALVITIIGTVAWIVLSATNAEVPDPSRTWPRLANVAIFAVPIVALLLGALLSRNIGGATFYEQQKTNRRIAALFLIALVGLLTALGEVIAAAVTFDAYGALIGAGTAALFGIGAALFAHISGSNVVLASSHARPANPATDGQLLNVVNEISLAANVPPPRVYVIPDEAANAMAVGTSVKNASIAVTQGLLNRFDREELQGVVGHEISHLRNGDSRYGVYVAILVGLVALVTDGFLQMVVRAWGEGWFFKGAEADDAKGAVAGLAAGVVFGLLLLAVALVLRLFAPIAALLVQAAVSRQREFLADSSSVELTRNPVGLAKALSQIKGEARGMLTANRGSQHLWFASPLGPGSDTGWHLLATHPTVDARIARLAELNPAGVENAVAGTAPVG